MKAKGYVTNAIFNACNHRFGKSSVVICLHRTSVWLFLYNTFQETQIGAKEN